MPRPNQSIAFSVLISVYASYLGLSKASTFGLDSPVGVTGGEKHAENVILYAGAYSTYNSQESPVDTFGGNLPALQNYTYPKAQTVCTLTEPSPPSIYAADSSFGNPPLGQIRYTQPYSSYVQSHPNNPSLYGQNMQSLSINTNSTGCVNSVGPPEIPQSSSSPVQSAGEQPSADYGNLGIFNGEAKDIEHTIQNTPNLCFPYAQTKSLNSTLYSDLDIMDQSKNNHLANYQTVYDFYPHSTPSAQHAQPFDLFFTPNQTSLENLECPCGVLEPPHDKDERFCHPSSTIGDFQPSDMRKDHVLIPTKLYKPIHEYPDGSHSVSKDSHDDDKKRDTTKKQKRVTENLSDVPDSTSFEIGSPKKQPRRSSFNNNASPKPDLLFQKSSIPLSPLSNTCSMAQMPHFIPTNMEEAVSHVYAQIFAAQTTLDDLKRLFRFDENRSFIGDYIEKHYDDAFKKKISDFNKFSEINRDLHYLRLDERKIREIGDQNLMIHALELNHAKHRELSEQCNQTQDLIRKINEIVQDIRGEYIEPCNGNNYDSNTHSFSSESLTELKNFDNNSDACKLIRTFLQATYLMDNIFPKRNFISLNTANLITECCNGDTCVLHQKTEKIFQTEQKNGCRNKNEQIRQDQSGDSDSPNNRPFTNKTHKKDIKKCHFFYDIDIKSKKETLKRIFIHQVLAKSYQKCLKNDDSELVNLDLDNNITSNDYLMTKIHLNIMINMKYIHKKIAEKKCSNYLKSLT